MVKGSGPRVDRELWRQFTVVAQPYFYPIDEGGAGWGVLTLALLAGVAGCAFWLTAIAGAVLLAIVPTEHVPPSAFWLKEIMCTQPLPEVALACFLLGAGCALAHRRQLQGRWKRWAAIALLMLLLLCRTMLDVCQSFVLRNIQNCLRHYEVENFYETVKYRYLTVMALHVIIAGFYRYARMKFARHWRSFLSKFFLKRYLSHQAFYKLDSNSVDTQIDNPDQRITDDVSHFTEQTLDFILDVLGSIFDLCSFASVLYNISPLLMSILIGYAIIGNTLVTFIGNKLVGINYEQLRRDADLRYSLIRVRENAESIAFYSGEALEGEGIRKRLDSTLTNYDQIITWSTVVEIYRKSFLYFSRLGPYLVVAPLYFTQEIDFGSFSQAQFAFMQVRSSLTLIVLRIRDISKFAAAITRLGAFYDALDINAGLHYSGKDQSGQDNARTCCWKKNADGHDNPSGVELGVPMVDASGVELGVPMVDGTADGSEERKVDEIVTTAASGKLEIRQMSLQTPTGRMLVQSLDLALNTDGTDSSRRLLIVGPSGVGKSSLLRAIAGLWTKGSGEINRPPQGEMLFLPQKPYMPLGDLRMQLLYPNPLADTTNEDILEILGKLSLGDLPQRFEGGFDAVQDWGRVLSVGEQQRVAAARCLLTSPAPSLLVLDEATSALPVKDEAVLYGLLCDKKIGYISVGHRESLHQYHGLVLELSYEGAWRLRPPDVAPSSS